jgi:hypothetical protein
MPSTSPYTDASITVAHEVLDDAALEEGDDPA